MQPSSQRTGIGTIIGLLEQFQSVLARLRPIAFRYLAPVEKQMWDALVILVDVALLVFKRPVGLSSEQESEVATGLEDLFDRLQAIRGTLP